MPSRAFSFASSRHDWYVAKRIFQHEGRRHRGHYRLYPGFAVFHSRSTAASPDAAAGRDRVAAGEYWGFLASGLEGGRGFHNEDRRCRRGITIGREQFASREPPMERFSPARPGRGTTALFRAVLYSKVIARAYQGLTPLAVHRGPVSGPIPSSMPARRTSQDVISGLFLNPTFALSLAQTREPSRPGRLPRGVAGRPYRPLARRGRRPTMSRRCAVLS